MEGAAEHLDEEVDGVASLVSAVAVLPVRFMCVAPG